MLLSNNCFFVFDRIKNKQIILCDLKKTSQFFILKGKVMILYSMNLKPRKLFFQF